MKVIISLLLLSFSILEVANDTLLEKRIKNITPPLSECVCASGVDPFLVQKWYTNVEYPNDPCFKCFAKCIGIKVGAMDTAGTFDENFFIKKVGAPIELIRNCTALAQNITDLCQKYYTHIKCINIPLLKSNP